MSLVNDMLRDLNKRTPVSNRAARVHGAINSSIDNKRPKTRAGLILAGGLLAALTAGYFWFESARVQLVQVPLAPAPAIVTTPRNVAPAPAVTNADAPANAAPITADMPAIELLAEFRELATQPTGFTLLIELSETTTFDVRERNANGIVLHIDGVDRYDRSAIGVPGMSLKLSGDGLEVGFALNEPVDFLVREDGETPNFDILVTASYRRRESVTELAPAPALQDPVPALVQPQAPVVAAPDVAPAPTPPAAASGDRNAAVRVSRELSFEERDRNNSQSALMLLQGGQMAEALQQLLGFLEQNPAAHQSRETLAKLLLAQQALAQASTVVDQGLEQVPNYAPFKKIKARLLMQDGEAAQALALLRNVPPSVVADTEYHELLATLYQQSNYHQQAIAAYQELLRTDRNQGRWWTGLGISLEAQNQGADARASYQAALQSPNLDANLRRFVQDRIANLGSPQ